MGVNKFFGKFVKFRSFPTERWALSAQHPFCTGSRLCLANLNQDDIFGLNLVRRAMQRRRPLSIATGNGQRGQACSDGASSRGCMATQALTEEGNREAAQYRLAPAAMLAS